MENEKLIKSHLNKLLRNLLKRNTELKLDSRELFLITTAMQFLNEPNDYTNKEKIVIRYENVHVKHEGNNTVRLTFASNNVGVLYEQDFRDIDGRYNASEDYLSIPLIKNKPETGKKIERIFTIVNIIADESKEKPIVTSDIQSLKKSKDAIYKYSFNKLHESLKLMAIHYGVKSEEVKKMKQQIDKLKKKYNK